jgi:hypothetical protein
MSDAVDKAKKQEEREKDKREKAAQGDKGVGQLGEAINLVKEYARQETLGPLRGAGRWIAFGAIGSVLLGTGSALLVLGLLRILQTETGDTFEGRWMSLLPYLAALVAACIVIGLAVSRIGKRTLNKD